MHVCKDQTKGHEELNSDYINGCFDNASTNAVCVYLMENMTLPQNVIFVFTADEEYDSEGSKHAANELRKYFGKEKINAIVLDVTYGFQDGVDFTIENDFIFKEFDGERFQYICFMFTMFCRE